MCPHRERGNLLDLSIKAARAQATVGEISFALEKVFGRSQGRAADGHRRLRTPGTERRIRRSQKVQGKVEQFLKREGRRPRILVAKLGQDGHDRGQQVVAAAFADLGFDVDVGPLFQTPEEAAQEAVDERRHIVGPSYARRRSPDARARTPPGAARNSTTKTMPIVLGGVIPPQDYDELYTDGALAIFGPGTVIPIAALKVLEILDATARQRGVGAMEARRTRYPQWNQFEKGIEACARRRSRSINSHPCRWSTGR